MIFPLAPERFEREKELVNEIAMSTDYSLIVKDTMVSKKMLNLRFGYVSIFGNQRHERKKN